MQTNKARYLFYKWLSFLIYIVPLVILFAVKSGDYISDGGGKTMSFWGYLLIIFAVVAFKDKVLNFAKKNTILTVSIIIFAIAWIMKYLANELLLISFISLLGSLISTFIEPVVNIYEARVKKEREGEAVGLLAHRDAWRLAYGIGKQG